MLDTCVIVGSDKYGYIEDVHMVLDHLFTVCFRTLIAKRGEDGV